MVHVNSLKVVGPHLEIIMCRHNWLSVLPRGYGKLFCFVHYISQVSKSTYDLKFMCNLYIFALQVSAFINLWILERFMAWKFWIEIVTNNHTTKIEKQDFEFW